MDQVRAKFRVDEETRRSWDQGKAPTIKLQAVYGGSEENRSFAEATPSGSIEMFVNNPAAAGFFELGAEYYVTFERAGKPAGE